MSALTVIRFLAIRLVIIALALAVLEFAFRQGLWERWAKPGSYAGQVVRIKQAVEALGPDKVDFVTIGDSRVGSGIDHERVAAAARAHGLTHVHVGSGGMHWMSTDLMIRWVKEQSPRLKNAVIATNVANFLYSGNGSYELGLAAPVSRPWNSEWMKSAVAFDRGDLKTYGVYSALFQYREDIQDFLKGPGSRLRDIDWNRKNGLGNNAIFHRYPIERNLCRVPLATLKTCADFSAIDAGDQNLVNQCRNELGKPPQEDWRDFADPARHPHLPPLRELRQKQLRDLPLNHPIVVVLMPVPKIFRETILPKGVESWTLSVLEPLQKEGLIEIHDFTRFLDGENGIDCTAFHDLYHQNSAGQARLTDALLPILEARFYAPAGNAAKP
jgi:hypothetical protein